MNIEITKTFRNRLTAAALAACSLSAANTAMAVPLNVDFGSAGGSPSAAFGAASGQIGFWNKITAFSTPSGILDISGAATSVAISITGFTMGGNFDLPAGDANDLTEDNFYDLGGGSWILSMTGLTDALYDIYLYEPHHPSVGTGSGTINGNAFAQINGGFGSGTFTLGSNYHKFSGVTVSGGTLTATGSQPGTFSGIAGLQLVCVAECESVVPEPTTLALMGIALAGLGFQRRKAAR